MTDIVALLGNEAPSLLEHRCTGTRKQKMAAGVALLNAIQDVYLSADVTVA